MLMAYPMVLFGGYDFGDAGDVDVVDVARVAVEGADVVPDGEGGEDAVSLALQQAFAWVFLNFHRADCSPAK